jgi:hypothetical protein
MEFNYQSSFDEIPDVYNVLTNFMMLELH